MAKIFYEHSSKNTRLNKESRTMKKYEKTVTIEETGKEVDIYVLKPNNDVITKADMYRAKMWNRCIRDGIIIKKELAILMEERGIWNQDKSNSEETIGKEIQKLERKLFRGENGKKPKVSEGQRIAIDMRNLRLKLRDLITERITLEENTAEALSDNARFDYFVAECTFYKDGRKVYDGVEDYSQKNSDEIAYAAAAMLGDILYSLDPNFEGSLPENKWLKAFNLVDDELSLINVEGDLVDTAGRKVNESGHFIDDKDNRVDINGVPLSEDGNYVMVDYENDLVPTPPKPKKKASPRKKTAKPKTDNTPEASKVIDTARVAEIITTES